MERIREASPRLKARIAGVLYLIIIVAASFAEFFVRGRLVVGGDAGATATNILAHEPLYLGLVTVGVTERKSVLLCIFSNPRALTIELILLTLSGYPEVLRGWDVGHTVLPSSAYGLFAKMEISGSCRTTVRIAEMSAPAGLQI